MEEGALTRLASSTSSVLSLRVLLDAFVRAGGKRASLLRRIGVSASVLERLDARIPFDALLRAWELAPALVGDDDFGLHVGAWHERGGFGLLEYLGRASATLGEALERLVRYQRLLHDRARLGLVTAAGAVTLSARLAGLPTGGPRHFQEALAAVLLTLARGATGVEIVPLEVAFQHAEPASLVEHRRVLRAPVRFGALQNQIVLTPATLALPLREADRVLVEVLDRCAALALERLPPASDGLRLCHELIATQIAAGETPRVTYIARELGVSPRSLQRALRQHQVSFRDVVDDVRKELAIAWATTTSEHAAQIAYRLGYADASAFHHAFRRWTGHTVSELRRRLARRQSA